MASIVGMCLKSRRDNKERDEGGRVGRADDFEIRDLYCCYHYY